MPITLEFPPTLRPAEREEIPNRESFITRLEEMQHAQLVPGYRLEFAEEEGVAGASFLAEINCNASQLWELIKDLTETMPAVLSFYFGLENMEMTPGSYLDREALLEDLQPYKTEICQDTFIECGFLFHNNEEYHELYINRFKYLKFRGPDPKAFSAVMEQYNLPSLDQLDFIDAYPRIRQPLTKIDEAAIESDQLINIWRKKLVIQP